MLRGREPGEVPALIRRGLLDAGVAADRIYSEPDEETAARILLDAAEPGDVIVLPVHTREVRERLHATLMPGSGAKGPRPMGIRITSLSTDGAEAALNPAQMTPVTPRRPWS